MSEAAAHGARAGAEIRNNQHVVAPRELRIWGYSRAGQFTFTTYTLAITDHGTHGPIRAVEECTGRGRLWPL